MIGSSLGTRVLLTTGRTAAPSASRSCPPVRIEAVGLAVQPSVAVERVWAEEDSASCPEQVTAQLNIDERPAGQYPDRAVKAQRFGDHGAGEGQPALGLVVGIGTG